MPLEDFKKKLKKVNQFKIKNTDDLVDLIQSFGQMPEKGEELHPGVG